MDMIYENNYTRLCGTLAGAPAYSHTGRGQVFYSFPLEVRRLSGNTDTVNIVVSRERLEQTELCEAEHIAVTGQEKVVQIAEHERGIEKFSHTVPLLSDAIKWVKYSGSSESKRRCSPVMGWMKPNVFAWRHWPWSLVMQLWGPYTGSPPTGC